MNESKIELTDKLRQLGIWGEASWFKDQCRRRLRASGLSRREANERAWQDMAELFDGRKLQHYLTAKLITIAEFPPSINTVDADLAHEIPFNYVWRLWCLCLARLECWECRDVDMASSISIDMSHDILAGYEQFAFMAINESNRFVIEIAGPKFVAVVKRLLASLERQDEYVEELRCHINEMKRFGLKEQLDGIVVTQANNALESGSQQNNFVN